MIRKLIKQKNSFTLTLPKKWIENRKLKSGDAINLDELEGNLIISTKGLAEKEIKIHFETKDKDLIRTLLSSYYRLGYTKIQLTFSNKVPYILIQNILTTLIDLELTEQKEKSCIVEDVSKTEQKDIPKIFNKFFQLLNWLYKSAIIENKDKEEIEYIRNESIKLRDYCQRTLVLQREEKSYEYYSFIISLEKIAFIYYMIGLMNKKNKSDLVLIKRYREILKEIHKVFLKFNLKMANKIYLKTKKLDIDFLKDSKKIKNKEILLRSFAYLEHLIILRSRLQIIASVC